MVQCNSLKVSRARVVGRMHVILAGLVWLSNFYFFPFTLDMMSMVSDVHNRL
jgi:hypothetical protein